MEVDSRCARWEACVDRIVRVCDRDTGWPERRLGILVALDRPIGHGRQFLMERPSAERTRLGSPMPVPDAAEVRAMLDAAMRAGRCLRS